MANIDVFAPLASLQWVDRNTIHANDYNPNKVSEENLKLLVEANYIALWLDKTDDVWGQSLPGGDHRDIRDAWNVSVLFIYSF